MRAGQSEHRRWLFLAPAIASPHRNGRRGLVLRLGRARRARRIDPAAGHGCARALVLPGGDDLRGLVRRVRRRIGGGAEVVAGRSGASPAPRPLRRDGSGGARPDAGAELPRVHGALRCARPVRGRRVHVVAHALRRAVPGAADIGAREPRSRLQRRQHRGPAPRRGAHRERPVLARGLRADRRGVSPVRRRLRRRGALGEAGAGAGSAPPGGAGRRGPACGGAPRSAAPRRARDRRLRARRDGMGAARVVRHLRARDGRRRRVRAARPVRLHGRNGRGARRRDRHGRRAALGSMGARPPRRRSRLACRARRGAERAGDARRESRARPRHRRAPARVPRARHGRRPRPRRELLGGDDREPDAGRAGGVLHDRRHRRRRGRPDRLCRRLRRRLDHGGGVRDVPHRRPAAAPAAAR